MTPDNPYRIVFTDNGRVREVFGSAPCWKVTRKLFPFNFETAWRVFWMGDEITCEMIPPDDSPGSGGSDQ